MLAEMFLKLNFKGLYQSSGKEKESCCLVFPSSTKREFKHFHVAVVQQRQRNVPESVMHVQSCCFANQPYSLFCRSRGRRVMQSDCKEMYKKSVVHVQSCQCVVNLRPLLFLPFSLWLLKLPYNWSCVSSVILVHIFFYWHWRFSLDCNF